MSSKASIPRPRKAILLAAGFGTRMRPLSYDLPKPMMPLWGKPLLRHMIDMLADWGVADILVNVHHRPGAIIDYLQQRTSSGPRIQLSFEPEILGTGGLLKRASWFLDDSPFWMANTDIAADLTPEPLLSAFASNPLAALWMHPTLGPRTVAMKEGLITDFRSPTPGALDTFTFCGIHLVSPVVMSLLPERSFFSVIEAYERGMGDGMVVKGVAHPNAFWRDVGTADRYIQAHRDVLRGHLDGAPGKRLMDPQQIKRTQRLKRKGVHIVGFAALGENVSVAAGADVEDSVLWDGALLTEGARVKRTVLSRDTKVACHTEFSAAIVCSKIPGHGNIHRTLRRLGWPADQTTALALEARGSNRSFTRLRKGRRSAVLIEYDTVRMENTRYASHARFLLRNGVSVPKVMFDMPTRHATIMEDLGVVSLQDVVPHLSHRSLLNHYKRVLDQLLLLHSIPLKSINPKRLEPPFSPTLYKWEHDLFSERLLAGHLALEERERFEIGRELTNLTRGLREAPNVLLHRDMQSSNILLRGTKPVLIDFQGMRRGPAAYDLASLLCDPYVMLDEQTQQRLLDYYLERSRHAQSVAGTFWMAAVQRLTQALGAYGRLSAMPETRRFAQYIAPGATMMLRALAHLDGLPRYGVEGLVKAMKTVIDAE